MGSGHPLPILCLPCHLLPPVFHHPPTPSFISWELCPAMGGRAATACSCLPHHLPPLQELHPHCHLALSTSWQGPSCGNYSPEQVVRLPWPVSQPLCTL